MIGEKEGAVGEADRATETQRFSARAPCSAGLLLASLTVLTGCTPDARRAPLPHATDAMPEASMIETDAASRPGYREAGATGIDSGTSSSGRRVPANGGRDAGTPASRGTSRDTAHPTSDAGGADAGSNSGVSRRVPWLPGPPLQVSGAGPNSIAVGDWNADGQVDVATTSAGENDIAVQLQLGGGRFTVPVKYDAGGSPRTLVAMDLNLDGKADLASASFDDGTVMVRFGTGGGSFDRTETYTVAPPGVAPRFTHPDSIVAADLNGDGAPELVVADQLDARVFVLVNGGDGSFTPRFVYTTGNTPNALIAADLDGDGHVDLAVADKLDGEVEVFLNRSDGTFADPVSHPAGKMPIALAAGDLNGDARVDLVVSNGDAPAAVMLNLGAGKFAAPVGYAARGAGGRIVIADVDDARGPDLVVGGAGVTVFRNRGDGTFETAASYDAAGPLGVAIADVNGDHRPDVVTVNAAITDNLGLLLNAGSGTFTVPATYATGDHPQATAIADVTGDGNPDLIVGGQMPNALDVLANDGRGTFAPAHRHALDRAPIAVVTGDFDGDDRNDVALVSAADQTQNIVEVILNQDGKLQAPSTKYSAGASPQFIVAVDLDRDGAPDLVVADPSGHRVNLLPNDGKGTFGPSGQLASVARPTSLCTSDLDRDGLPDVVATDADNNEVVILLGDGKGGVRSEAHYPAGPNPFSVVAGDLDADGLPDLVVGDAGAIVGSGDYVSVLLNSSTGTFGQAVHYIADDLSGVAIADLNTDGALDVVVASSSLLHVRLNVGSGNLGDPIGYVGGSQPSAVLAADLNGDRRPDLVTMNGGTENVRVLLNTPAPAGW